MRYAVVLVAVLMVGCGDTSLSPEAIDNAVSFVDKAQKAGLVTKFTCTGNEANVSPLGWAAFNADQKRGLVISLAVACDAQSSGRRITVFDHQSGRKLAEYTGGSYEVF
jgi:hypothetical protein